jgi:uncharacterized protein YigA (DUF484 family)
VTSLALIPLRSGQRRRRVGVWHAGAGFARRAPLHSGMGTDFLARIGELVSAALSRLK